MATATVVVSVELVRESRLTSSPPQQWRLAMHWLAVEGVQPLTPENPVLLDEGAKEGGSGNEVTFPSMLSEAMQVCTTPGCPLGCDSGCDCDSTASRVFCGPALM